MSTKEVKKFAMFKIVSKTRDGRGIGQPPNEIVDSVEDYWDELQ